MLGVPHHFFLTVFVCLQSFWWLFTVCQWHRDLKSFLTMNSIFHCFVKQGTWLSLLPCYMALHHLGNSIVHHQIAPGLLDVAHEGCFETIPRSWQCSFNRNSFCYQRILSSVHVLKLWSNWITVQDSYPKYKKKFRVYCLKSCYLKSPLKLWVFNFSWKVQDMVALYCLV